MLAWLTGPCQIGSRKPKPESTQPAARLAPSVTAPSRERAQHASAVRAVAARAAARCGARPPSASRATQPQRRRRRPATRSSAWPRSTAQLEAAARVGRERAPAPAPPARGVQTAPSRPAATAPGPHEAARHRERDVVEQRRVAAQRARATTRSDVARQLEPDAVERQRPHVAVDEEVVRAPASRRPPCGRSTSRKSAFRLAVRVLEVVVGVLVRQDARRERPAAGRARRSREQRRHPVALAHRAAAPARPRRAAAFSPAFRRPNSGVASASTSRTQSSVMRDRHRVARGLLDVVDPHARQEVEDAVLPAGQRVDAPARAARAGSRARERGQQRRRVGAVVDVDQLGQQRDARRRASWRRRWRRAAPPRTPSPPRPACRCRRPRDTSCTRARSSRALRNASIARRQPVRLLGARVEVDHRHAVERAPPPRARAQKPSPSAQVDARRRIRVAASAAAQRRRTLGRDARAGRSTSSSTIRAPRSSCASAAAVERAPQLGDVPRREPHHQVRGVRQRAPSRARSPASASTTTSERVRRSAARIGGGDGLEVGALHRRRRRCRAAARRSSAGRAAPERASAGAARRRCGTPPPAACARCPRRSRTPRAARRSPGA